MSPRAQAAPFQGNIQGGGVVSLCLIIMPQDSILVVDVLKLAGNLRF